MFQAYVITCIPTGKHYIGITGSTLCRRWNEHVYNAKRQMNPSALYAAIRRYGGECFRIEPVCVATSLDDIRTIETKLIQQWGTLAPHGYNLTLGGEGRFGFSPSAESIEKSAAKHRGIPCHENTRSAAAKTHGGKPKSQAHRAKISAAKRGVVRSSATKAKLAEYWAKRRSAGQFKTTRPYENARQCA